MFLLLLSYFLVLFSGVILDPYDIYFIGTILVYILYIHIAINLIFIVYSYFKACYHQNQKRKHDKMMKLR